MTRSKQNQSALRGQGGLGGRAGERGADAFATTPHYIGTGLRLWRGRIEIDIAWLNEYLRRAGAAPDVPGGNNSGGVNPNPGGNVPSSGSAPDSVTGATGPTGAGSWVKESVVRPALDETFSATGALVSGSLYALYLGRVQEAMTLNKVYGRVTSAGSGTQTAEMAILSTAAEPSTSAQDMTIKAVSGSLDSLTGTGYKANTSNLGYSASVGEYLWAAFWVQMSVTQPAFQCHITDGGLGRFRYKAGVTSLVTTGVSGVISSVSPAGATSVGPYLQVTRS